MALEIRRASQRRDVALELAEAAGTVPRVFPVRATLNDDPAEVGHRLRKALGIPVTTQEAWKDEYEALRVWREAMEALGVLVFRGQLDVDEARGFSLGEDLFPAVVISSKDAPVARIFTLMHELAHVALRSGGVCDLEEATKLNRPEERVEVFCNAAAGEVLVPGDSLLRTVEVQSHGQSGTWDDGVLGDLGRRFHVSREVILRRLVTLGKASMGVYRSRRALWQSRLPVKTGSGFEAQDDKVIRECGQLYTRIVLSSYHEKAISLGDASDFLNVKTRFIPAVEQALHMSRSSFA
jgi:Zn-dependent peptidase ImmA (M78 family)